MNLSVSPNPLSTSPAPKTGPGPSTKTDNVKTIIEKLSISSSRLPLHIRVLDACSRNVDAMPEILKRFPETLQKMQALKSASELPKELHLPQFTNSVCFKELWAETYFGGLNARAAAVMSPPATEGTKILTYLKAWKAGKEMSRFPAVDYIIKALESQTTSVKAKAQQQHQVQVTAVPKTQQLINILRNAPKKETVAGFLDALNNEPLIDTDYINCVKEAEALVKQPDGKALLRLAARSRTDAKAKNDLDTQIKEILSPGTDSGTSTTVVSGTGTSAPPKDNGPDIGNIDAPDTASTDAKKNMAAISAQNHKGDINAVRGGQFDLSQLAKTDDLYLREGRVLTIPVFAGNEKKAENRDFKVIGLLGTGAFAKAYYVQDTKTLAPYVIKAIPKTMPTNRRMATPPPPLNDPDIIAQLNHQAITKVYQTIQTNSQLFVLTELAKGDELADQINEKGLKIDDYKALKHQLISGVAHMHSRSVVHLDIKPKNIIRDPATNEIRIIDFGESRQYKSNQNLNGINLTNDGQQVGTLGYIPLESKDGITEKNATKIDTFAVGVTLLETLIGSTELKRYLPDIPDSVKSFSDANPYLPATVAGIQNAIAAAEKKASDSAFMLSELAFIRQCTHPDPGQRSMGIAPSVTPT